MLAQPQYVVSIVINNKRSDCCFFLKLLTTLSKSTHNLFLLTHLNFLILAIERIPSYRYSSKDSKNGSCVICMMEYSNREKLRRLKCEHNYHSKCIDRWLKVLNPLI